MSDIHVLKGLVRGDVVHKQYAFHFQIPGTDQVADAAKDPDLQPYDPQDQSGFQSVVPDIQQAELDAIRAGQIVEVVVTMDYHKDETPASVQARVKARYNDMLPRVIERYKEVYRFYTTAISAG